MSAYEQDDAFQETLDLESTPLVPDQGEDEGDLTDPASAFHASIGGKDWTVETLVSQMRKGRIDLDPSFQRRNAWLGDRKSKLIESIMLGFPIPQIVLAEKRDQPGQYFVLDGKQRLLALRQFFVDPDDPRDEGFKAIRLTGLEVLSELNRKDAQALEEVRPELFAALENHSIRTVVLGKWNSERLLLSLFLRLNTGSVALSPQELRQALIHGDFMKWLDGRSGELPALRVLLNNSHPDRRMVDAELMLRHLSFAISPVQYRGNLKQFLDDTSRHLNKNWESAQGDAKNALGEFEESLAAGLKILGRDRFCHKWSNDPATPAEGKFERALNRAVFDIQVHSLSFKHVREAASDRGNELLEAFKTACEKDETFVRSITSTTKTVDAFITRHRVWKQIIHDTCGVGYDLPLPLRRV
ncbi:DUF262 domain-containing protein [Arthrobacter mobilis]|uniref:DUF262 domain-containing protein n=1 Tax=Arthrobacter mobilis TaxID=2724944 RepID=A0A7X6HDV6_9MICC|nr:DUF262 domain-containing protein [Arthrobacter mobilis]NKX54378.1 DUF262 domain-containing protein [Arthrobacter mobilis]